MKKETEPKIKKEIEKDQPKGIEEDEEFAKRRKEWEEKYSEPWGALFDAADN
ncbi:MAG: hypothetical protein UT26_C0024G0012 [Microgenomates group bacterium GW2011_GWC1_39_12]|nr:MAG: hypothetical protein UT26_C0024G0012 [Microgenomates group bacterium GW2011_GWC1_39_12]